MSRVIDERVAALRFDNAQFERNVGTSLSTLDKLKRALDFTGHTKSFQDIEAAAAKVTFSRMADSLDELRYRFSTLGIVGMTVIQDLTRTVERFVTGTLSSLIGKIYEGGKARAFNIENAHFLLQGLYDDAEKIKAIEDDAMQSVTDTAYGYDEAIKTAASLAASGVSAGKEMQSVLAGIAGVAATTSSEYSAIADVFRDAAGRGRAMGYELSRLSGYGINAAKVLSDYFNAINDGSKQADESITAAVKSITGGAKVTEAEIMDMASKSKISFEVFAQAISDTFGKHAKEANKTVVGTLSNINARFSQIGAKFFSPLIAQEGPLVTFLNKVMNKFGELRDKIDPIAKLFTDTVTRILDIGGRLVDAIPVAAVFDKINKYVDPLSKKLDSVFGTIDKYAKPVSTITEENIKGLGLSEKALSHFQNVLKDVAKEHNIDLDSMLKSENSFWDSLKNGWLTSDIFKEALDKITGGAKDATEEFNKLKEAAVAVIRGDYGNGAERIAALTSAGFDPEKVQAYVNKIHELTGGTWDLNDAVLEAAAAEVGFSSNLENVSDKELEALGYTEEDIKALRELGEEADKTATPFGRFSASIEKVRKKLSELYNKAKEIAENIFKNVKAIGGSIEDAFGDVFGNLFSSLPDFDTIKAGAKNGLGFISSFLSSFTIDESRLDQIKRIFRGVFSIVHIVLEFASRIFGGVLPAFFEDGKNGAESLIETLATIGDKIYEFSQKFEISDDTLNKIVRTLKGVLAAASIVFGFLSFFVRTAFGPFVGVLSYVFEFVLDKAALLGDILVEIDKKIKETDLFKNTLDKITGIFDKVKTPKKLTEFFKSIKSVSDISKKIDAKSIKSMLETVVSAVSNAVSDFLSVEVVAAIAIFFLIYKSIKGIIGLFSKVIHGPGALIDIVSNLGKAFKSMGGMFENIGKAAKKFGIASMIFSIAFAFGQIAKAVYLLSEMDDAKIKQAIVMTVLIGGIIIGIYAAIAAMDAKANIRPSLEAIGFLIVATLAFKKIADALLEIKDLSWQQIGVGLIGLVGALALMGLVGVMLSKLETKLSLSALAFPILYAKGLKDIAKALATLKDMGWTQLLNAFGALMASLAIMAVIAQKLSELKTELSLSALAFPILYAKGLKDIAKAFVTIKDLDGNQLTNVFGSLLGALGIMAYIAHKLSSLKTELSLSALAFPILYAKGLKDIAKAFATLKDLSDWQVVRSFLALMATLSIMAVIAQKLSELKTKIDLSALAFPILYAKGLKDIAKAFNTLKDIGDSQLLRAFGALMASLVVMTAIAEYLSNKKSELSLSALAFPILYAKGLKDIAKAFATLKDIGWSQLLNAFGALMASLVVMTAIAEYLSNKKSELSLSALAFPILYAKGLKDIAKAFATLKDIDEGDLLRAFGALMASLVIMTIIAEFLSSEKSKLDASVLAFPIAFGAGLLLVALAIRAVGTMASEDLAQGLNTMLGVIIVLGAIIGVMSGFTAPLKQIADVFLEFAFSSVLIGAGFAIIAVGFIALAVAIKMFEGVSIEQVVIGLIALAGAMAILVIASKFLTVTGVGLIFLGTAFVLISIGVYILIEGLVRLAENFDTIAEAASKFGAAIANLVGGIAKSIFENLPLIFAAGVAIVGALALGIGAGPLLLIAAVGLLVYFALKTLAEFFPEFPKWGLSFVQGIGNGIAAGIGWVAEQAFNLAKSAKDAFCGFLGINSPSTVMAAAGVDMNLGLASGIDSSSFLPIGSMNNMSLDMLSAYAGPMFGEGGIGFLSSQIPVEAASGIQSATGVATDGVGTLVGSLKEKYLSDMYNEDGTWKGAASKIPEGMADGVTENSGQVTDAASMLKNILGDEFDTSDMSQYFDYGALVPTTEGSGIESNASDLLGSNDAVNQLLQEQGLDFANSDDVVNIGEAFDLSQITGMDNNAGEVSDKAEEVATDAADAAESTKGDWRNIGENLSHALARGIGDGKSDAINSAINVAVSAYNAAKSALAINSPSKLFIKLGQGIDEGFIVGMERMSGNVADTSTLVATGIVNAAKDPLDYLADLMSGDIIDDPTITPVLDLSEIQNGANRLYSMMSDVDRYSLNGNIALANDASLSINRDQRRKQESENQMMGTLIDAINGLSALIGNTGNVYNVNGVTYDDGSNVSSAVRSLIRAAKIEGRA